MGESAISTRATNISTSAIRITMRSLIFPLLVLATILVLAESRKCVLFPKVLNDGNLKTTYFMRIQDPNMPKKTGLWFTPCSAEVEAQPIEGFTEEFLEEGPICQSTVENVPEGFFKNMLK